MTGTGLPARNYPLGRILLVWLAVSLLLILTYLQNVIAKQFPDPDDILRLVQVRDLIGGQAWFDFRQMRIDPASPPVMHWSRLVDLPLWAIIAALSPIMGQSAAEHVAAIVVPLLALLVTLLCIGRTASRVFDREIVGFACLAVGFLPLLVYQLQPMRIDHHGWQICAVAAGLAGITGVRSWRGGAVAGLAMALGMIISLELLPIAAIFGAVLGLRWLRDRAERFWLVGYLQVLAGGLIIAFVATRGAADLALYCDTITWPHILFFGCVAIGATALAYAPPLPPAAVIGGLGLSGAIGLSAFGLASPGCLRTPFGALDPVVRDFWYINVLEGQPIWRQSSAALGMALQVLAGFAAGLVLLRKACGQERGWWLDYLLVFAGLTVLGVFVWRSMAFASLLAAIPLSYALKQGLDSIRLPGKTIGKIAIGLGLLVVFAPVVAVGAVQKATTAQAPDAMEKQSAVPLDVSTCDIQTSAQQLASLPSGTVFAPLDLGPAILQHSDHAVIATAHHRAEAAMADVIRGFSGDAAGARIIIAAHGAGYVVLCSDVMETELYASRGGPQSFAARLRIGDAPQWLAPVALDVPDSFRIWRVID